MICPICGNKESDKPRSVAQNRLYWGMLKLVSEHSDSPAFQGSDGPQNLHEAIKIAMGYVKPIYNLDGEVTGYKADSIAFHRMTPDKFSAFFDKAQTFIFNNIVPFVEKDSFENELCNILQIPTIDDCMRK